MSLFDINDFIICHENNDYKCCGYKIDNKFLKNDESPLITNNSKSNNLDNVSIMSDLFNNTAFPIGLLYNNYDDKNYLDENTNEVISDDLYSKLLKLAEENKDKKINKKTKKSNNKKKTTKNTTKKKS